MMHTNVKNPWLKIYVAVAVLLYLSLFFFSLGIARDQRMRGIPERLAYPIAERDQIGYADIADNILAGHGFSEKLSAPFTPGTFRTPGLPALLVVWKTLFRSYAAFPIFQIALAVAAAFLISRIGEKLYSPKVGGFAGLLFLLDPNTVYHTMVMQTDLLNAFMAVLVVYLFCVSDKRPSRIGAFIFGLLIGYATLVRPISMFLVIFFMPFYWYFERKLGWKKLVANLLVFLLGFCLLVVPWVVRNKIETGVAGISSVKDYNFFQYYIPSYMAYKMGITEAAAKDILLKELAPVKDNQTDSLAFSPEVNAVWMRHFKEDPLGYIKFHLVKTLPVFLSSGTKTFLEGYGNMMSVPLYTNPANTTDLLIRMQFGQALSELLKDPFIMIEEVALGIIWLLALLSLCFRKNRPYTILLIGVILYFALLTGTVAYSRFRLPIAPFLFLLSLFTLSQFRLFFKGRRLGERPRT